jgi:hypothetical protein
VYENILAAIIRLDESEAFAAIEPLYGSLRHEILLSKTCFSWLRSRAALITRDWKKVISPTHSVRRGQVFRPKLDENTIVHRRDFYKRHGPNYKKLAIGMLRSHIKQTIGTGMAADG